MCVNKENYSGVTEKTPTKRWLANVNHPWFSVAGHAHNALNT